MTELFDLTGLQEEQKQSFYTTFNEVDKCFILQAMEDVDIPFGRFELFEHYSQIKQRGLFQIANGGCRSYLAFLEVHYSYAGYKGGRYAGQDYQVWAAAKLSADFGHVLIKREEFNERFTELLRPIELNFPEDHTFCRKCYVLSTNEDKARQLLTRPFRDEVKRILVSDFYLEILNDWLIIGNRKMLDSGEALALASFVFNVSELAYTTMPKGL